MYKNYSEFQNNSITFACECATSILRVASSRLYTSETLSALRRRYEYVMRTYIAVTKVYMYIRENFIAVARNSRHFRLLRRLGFYRGSKLSTHTVEREKGRIFLSLIHTRTIPVKTRRSGISTDTSVYNIYITAVSEFRKSSVIWKKDNAARGVKVFESKASDLVCQNFSRPLSIFQSHPTDHTASLPIYITQV